MSGHSKWSKIKHQKAVKDPKKSAAFTKIIGLISVAAKENSNPESNPKLRLAIEKAKELGMPKDNVERAIKRNSGESTEKENWEELCYEAYGPYNSALLIQVITNNKNRSFAEIRHLLQTYGAKMAETGSVKWLFKEVAKIIISKKDWNDDLELQVIEQGVEDIQKDEENVYIYTASQNIVVLKNFLISNNKFLEESINIEYDFVSQQPIFISDEETKKSLEDFFEALDDHQDVKEIYSNIEFK